VVAGLLCDVQVCSLTKMITQAEDGSRRGFVSQFTRRVRWVLLLSRAARSCGGISAVTMTGRGWFAEYSVGARPA
jgi:hypothetical protein